MSGPRMDGFASDAGYEIARQRMGALEGAVREYAQHQSWRCEHEPHFYYARDSGMAEKLAEEGDCPCGLKKTLRELGIT